MSQQTPLTRDQVPFHQTWDLSLIYPSDQDFDQALDQVQAGLAKLLAWKDKAFTSGNNLLAYLKESMDLEETMETAYVYSDLKSDQDTSNDFYQTMNQKAYSVYTKLSEANAWFEPALLSLDNQAYQDLFQEEQGLAAYQVLLDTMRLKKAHVLSDKEEALFAKAEGVLSGPRSTFNVLNNADLPFGQTIDEEGNLIQLTHGNYSQLMESKMPQVRQSAFKTMYQPFMQLKNTFASTLSTEIKAHNFRASAHHYESARQAALSANQVPEEVYDALLEVVNEKLPLLHRYIDLQAKTLGIDEMHMYDMYVPITGDAPISFNYEEACQEALKALEPLGKDYQAIIQKAFDQRWIDVAENVGKRSGGYSSGGYATAPYILLNWHDILSNFFTLIHELGHSAHSYLTRSNQPYQYGDYSIFLAEIASTTNENLLTDYLLKQYPQKEAQIYILNNYLNRMKSTIFRQTQFAEFEHTIHQMDQEGIPLTQASMSKLYGEINAKYYGPQVVQDPEIAYEWARIPHFYMNYYVFQYATGMAAATALSQKILSGQEGAVEAYLNYLKAGRSDAPIEIMKKAGVDMTQKAYLYDAMDQFEQRLQQLEALLSQD